MANHLGPLLRKNFILWRRNKCGACCELMLPVVFLFLLFVIRNTTDKNTIEQQSFASKALPLFADQTSVPAVITDWDDLKVFKNCKDETFRDNDWRNGKIAFAPSNDPKFDFIWQGLQPTFTKMGYEMQPFASKDKISDHIVDEDYKFDICFGIVFNEATLGSEYKYELMFNTTSGNEELDDIPDTREDDTVEFKHQMIDENLDRWVESGFLSMQNLIDNLILRKETNDSTYKIQPRVHSIQVAEHEDDEIVDVLKSNFQTYIVLPMIVVFLRMTYGMLEEKEKKIKEGMKIMGMKDSSFYLSWMIQYGLVYLVISFISTIVLKGTVFPESNFLIIFLWHFMFGLSCMAQSFFIQVFFTKAKLGNIVAMIFYLFQYSFRFFLSEDNVSYNTKTWASLSSQTNISFSANVFLLVEGQQRGIDFSNADLKVDNFDVQTGMLMLLLNIFLFAIIGLYLDQVFPNEFGKKKRPLFFIHYLKDLCKKNESNKVQSDNPNKQSLLRNEVDIDPERFEEVTDPLKLAMDQRNEVVKVRGLRKTYPNGFKAVKGLDMTMYKNDIFVLLGHNGAGKTTTMQMLTGMTEITDGEAVAFGFDVRTQMEEIRKITGLCPQHDILFN